MDIEKALREAKLDIRLSRDDAPHAWFGIMEFEAASLLADQPDSTYFAFNCSQQLQAYAVHGPRLIVVTAGLFDFLCKLVGRIVASELFSTVGHPADRAWTPDPERSERIARDLIQGEPFDVKSPPWKGDLEREGLYFYVLLTLFRFVVLHEFGHLYHQHGQRSGSVKVAMDIDTIPPRLLPSEEALNSQARELVADRFAMLMLLGLQEAEIERIANTPLLAPLGEKLLNTHQKRVAFLLNVIHVYFAATDRLPTESPEDSLGKTHPPAAFRLITIAATTMEETSGSLGERAARDAVVSAGLVGDALLAVALDRKPNPAWLARMQDRTFSDHYAKLYKRVGLWTRRR